MKNICIGDTASFTKTISESVINKFAELVGDYNDVHVNQIEAEKSIFGGRIAHGMLVGSLISTVLGTELPGKGTIYLEQNFKFKKAVYINDTVTAFVTVIDIINKEKGIIKLDTIIKNQNDDVIIEGYAVVMCN